MSMLFVSKQPVFTRLYVLFSLQIFEYLPQLVAADIGEFL
jgi:hypothetical protein